MKNHDFSSPIWAAQRDLLPLIASILGVILGMIIMSLPEEAKTVLLGTVFLVSAALAAHLIHERINGVSDEGKEEKLSVGPVNLPFRDIIAKKRSKELMKQRMAA